MLTTKRIVFVFFLADALEQLKLRIFHSNGVPVESTLALTEKTFKLGAELMVLSIVQGGPALNFMSPLIYDIISRGLTGQTCLSLDMIENENFKTVAHKVKYILMYDDFTMSNAG